MPDNFADSTAGKIFIGLVFFSTTGILSYVGGRLSAPEVAPLPSLIPEKVEIEAGKTVQFSAAQSTNSPYLVDTHR